MLWTDPLWKIPLFLFLPPRLSIALKVCTRTRTENNQDWIVNIIPFITKYSQSIVELCKNRKKCFQKSSSNTSWPFFMIFIIVLQLVITGGGGDVINDDDRNLSHITHNIRNICKVDLPLPPASTPDMLITFLTALPLPLPLPLAVVLVGGEVLQGGLDIVVTRQPVEQRGNLETEESQPVLITQRHQEPELQDQPRDLKTSLVLSCLLIMI